MLSTKHMRFRVKVRKFQSKFIGSFEIEKMIGLNVARLILPKVYARMRHVFHVSLLRKYEVRKGFQPLPPPLEFLDEDSVHEVEEVLAHMIVSSGKTKGRKKRITKVEYLIQWKGKAMILYIIPGRLRNISMKRLWRAIWPSNQVFMMILPSLMMWKSEETMFLMRW